MDPLSALADADRSEVVALVDAVSDADGVRPLNEEAHLQLEGARSRHWLVRDAGRLLAYAQLDPTDDTAQLCVDPAARRRGHGRALADAIRAEAPAARLWAFGDLPAARGLAEAAGLEVERELLMMGRELPADLGGRLPDGVRVAGFTPDAASDFLAVNARAFAGHPEQGSFDADDLAARQAEDWWDPEGLLLAWDANGLAGFHWTKRHPDGTGEVYVIGVDPRMAGRRLGSGLLQAGLDHLAAGGSGRVILYVDGGNARAVDLYRSSGFAVEHRDVLYG